MNCLFLDIASHGSTALTTGNGFLACVSEKGVMASREVTTRIRDHELIPLVEEILKEAGWEYEDLTHIACVVGPGGFTSLRVAVSFTNTLMDQLGIAGTGIHLSELYFERYTTAAATPASLLRENNVLWFHTSKRDSLFVRGFGKSERLWPEPAHLSLDEFKGKAPKGAFWMGELLEEQKEEFKSLNFKEAPLKSPGEVLPVFLAQQDFGHRQLLPWYGRGG